MTRGLIVLKPEAQRQLGVVEAQLASHSLKVETRHRISEWPEVGREIYAPQTAKDLILATELSAYMWITCRLFGATAIALVVRHPLGLTGDLVDCIQRFKADTRTRLYEADAPIRIVLDLDQTPVTQVAPIGLTGTLGVGGTSFEGMQFSGRWEYFYLKYIHTPDPSEARHEAELSILQTAGVFDQSVSDDEWSLMKQRCSFF